MLSYFFRIFLRDKNPDWISVDSKVYELAYHQFGGSVLMHPKVIEAMSSLASVPIKYYAYYQNDILLGVLPIWGNYLAGDKRYLKKIHKRQAFDLGNAEVILPISNDLDIKLPFKGQNISEIHSSSIVNLKMQSERISLARSFRDGDFSRKFRYNRRRELKIFERDGGSVIPFSALTTDEISRLYIELFEKRWAKKPKAHETLAALLEKIHPLLKGHYLTINNKPVAIQLIYLAQTAINVSVEYINGGVDLQYKQYSPGSILSFLNIQLAEEIAERNKLPLRFSFGLMDKEYKNTWCNFSPLYKV